MYIVHFERIYFQGIYSQVLGMRYSAYPIILATNLAGCHRVVHTWNDFVWRLNIPRGSRRSNDKIYVELGAL